MEYSVTVEPRMAGSYLPASISSFDRQSLRAKPSIEMPPSDKFSLLPKALRHARPWAGHPRLASLRAVEVVDGRAEPGHDEAELGKAGRGRVPPPAGHDEASVSTSERQSLAVSNQNRLIFSASSR
jgi:hypothetical protein